MFERGREGGARERVQRVGQVRRRRSFALRSFQSFCEKRSALKQEMNVRQAEVPKELFIPGRFFLFMFELRG